MTPLLGQRSRQDRSFERLYRRHSGDVYRYALAVLRNPSDAEDVTQTTFMNAYRAFSRGEKPQAPKNWLIAIAHNACRQRFRQAARRPSEVELNEDITEALVVDEPVSADDIQRALEHLAFNQRAALVMRELEGRSYSEIAEILEVSVSAVETLIFRARRALREQLEGALTCDEAELAISKQADGQLSRAEKGQLRAHLRECASCQTLARRLRAQRGAWKTLAAVPLPGTLHGLFGGSSASTAAGVGIAGGGSAVAIKAATVVTAVAVAGGTVYEGKQLVAGKAEQTAAPASVASGGAGSTAATSITSSASSARAFAPGQIKPDGERATKPTVPPGLAKKGEDKPVAKGLGATQRAHPEQGPKNEPPGQARKADQAGSSTTAPSHTASSTQTSTDTPQKSKKKAKKRTAKQHRVRTTTPQAQSPPKAQPEPRPTQPAGGGATGAASGKK